MTLSLGFRATALAVLVAGAGLTVAAPASAAPPVAVDDHKWMYPGQFRTIDVLANDSDPDGDDLAVCRLAPIPEDAPYFAGIEDGKVFVWASEDPTEDIVITYYACDYDTLVPATLTISFREIVPVVAEKAQRPGRIRVTNDNDRSVMFLYGSFREPRPDGRVKVPANGSMTVRVHRHTIDWIAILARSVPAGVGHVRGIVLPGDDRAAAKSVAALTRAERKAWAAR
jgi:hypothetical protein